jgi:hypothetical protein
MSDLLGRGDIESLLRELAQRLNDAGLSVGIRIVGGAAIALMNSDRRATQDIDALLLPAEAVQAAAAEMAIEHDLRGDWINDAAKAFVPFVGLDEWREIYREGGVVVSVGSVEMLLAMKLRANRGRRDTDDIEFLLEQCAVTSLEQAEAIYGRYRAQELLSQSACLRVTSWLATRQ